MLAFNAYMVPLARTSAGLAASYTLVNPIIAMLLGVTFGNETITAPEWMAAGVILVGVVLLLIRPAPWPRHAHAGGPAPNAAFDGIAGRIELDYCLAKDAARHG